MTEDNRDSRNLKTYSDDPLVSTLTKLRPIWHFDQLMTYHNIVVLEIIISHGR